MNGNLKELRDKEYKYDKKDFFSQIIIGIISIIGFSGGCLFLYGTFLNNKSYCYSMYFGFSFGLWGVVTLINDIFFIGKKLDPIFKNKVIKREIGVGKNIGFVPIRIPAFGIDSCEARPLRVNIYSIVIASKSKKVKDAFKGYDLNELVSKPAIVFCRMHYFIFYYVLGIPFGIMILYSFITWIISWF